ncbi:MULTISPECIES: MurR/RpiR family transcriptional regulator [Bacillus]|uniref:MurR/RpiR family transcriptional regulator n=1 Tax=Bacillus glycinifermentans TaxID=1664069 RepID=A0AAJ3YVK9_9BACI|nr:MULTISPECIES: MurR/RpiR family transcriptional regulator [Bacillus]KKB71645.1 RpiR family transcriptional regulator [Bacillus sp. TH008]MBU8785774.1 MurR/RpiR family transcriptional regulator [Bacillus glycinifermentans]MDU0072953.1 MurR/RpiR family transcriptional regulator [Bacillus sp. IG6]MED8020809.1 MurR/RpiR family transcriptional regulator [Bacillus glycinifermentans]NUJ15689.1 MurR/RpiR family transcriptional regulator [Bacillus glycinifermentans]
MAAGGLDMIRTMLHKLPQSERKLAEYILENPQEIVNSTIQEISGAANTSGAAAIRLCKSLGLKGYQDLKLRIAGDLMRSADQGYRDIEPQEPLYSIAQKTASNSIQVIRDTLDNIDQLELQKAIQMLITAGTVHFCGIGASGIVAQDAQQKFLRIKKGATAFTDMHLIASLIANADEHDIVFAISHSGETREIIDVLKLAKERGVKTIGLTRFGQSAVSSICDVALYTSCSNEAPFRSAATSSRLAQLYMIDILFLGMAAKRYEETIQYIDQSKAAIQTMGANRS